VTGRYARNLAIIAAVGAGISGGVFFAFSTFVMKAIDRLPTAQSITAMNAMNKAAPAPLFMLALFGTAAVGLALSVAALRHLDQRWGAYALTGTALYLVSVILTIAYHVPHNDALALVDPTGPGAARAWANYFSPWTAWNHVRTVTALAGSTAFILAVRAVACPAPSPTRTVRDTRDAVIGTR
jgi:uncharacterized membrane protein